MNHFVITGFPRSRTAWLANLFTYDNSWCYHESIGIDHTAYSWGKLNNCDFYFLGESSSGIYAFAEEFNRLYPEAKWLIIDRRRKEAEDSYREYFRDNPHPAISTHPFDVHRVFDACEHGLKEIMKTVKHKELTSFDGLEDVCTLRWISNYIMPGNVFNLDRAEMLQRLRINQIPAKLPTKGVLAWAQ